MGNDDILGCCIDEIRTVKYLVVDMNCFFSLCCNFIGVSRAVSTVASSVKDLKNREDLG